MAVVLSRDHILTLGGDASPPPKIVVGVGWDARRGGSGKGELKADLDISCILFSAAGKMIEVLDFNNLKSKDGAVIHTGDSQTGAGSGVDESIIIDLPALDEKTGSMVIVLTSYTGMHISDITGIFAKLMDMSSGGAAFEIASIDVSDEDRDPSGTAIVLCRIFRAVGANGKPKKDEWKVQALGRYMHPVDATELVSLVEERVERGGPKVLTLAKGDVVFFDGPAKISLGASWRGKSGEPVYEVAAFLFDKNGNLVDKIDKAHTSTTDKVVMHMTQANLMVATADDPAMDKVQIAVGLERLDKNIRSIVLALIATGEGKVESSMREFDSGVVRLLNTTTTPAKEVVRVEVEDDAEENMMLLCTLARDPATAGKWTLGAVCQAAAAANDEEMASVAKSAIGDVVPKSLTIKRGDLVNFEGPRAVTIGVGWAGAANAKGQLEFACLGLTESGQLELVVDMKKNAFEFISVGQGRGYGDDNEQMTIQLKGVPPSIRSLVFLVTAYSTSLGRRGLKLARAHLRIMNATSKPPREIANFPFPVSGDDSALLMGILFRDTTTPGKWTLKAVGDPIAGASNQAVLPAILPRLEGAIPKALVLSKADVVSFAGPTIATVALEWAAAADAATCFASCSLFDMEGNLVNTVEPTHPRALEGVVAYGADSHDKRAEIHIMLTRVPRNIRSLVFTLTVPDRATMEAVTSATALLLDSSNSANHQNALPPREIARFGVEGSDDANNALIMCLLYRDSDGAKWKLQAVGDYVRGSAVRQLTELNEGAAMTSAAQDDATEMVTLRKSDILSFEGPHTVAISLAWDQKRAAKGSFTTICLLVDPMSKVLESVDLNHRESSDQSVRFLGPESGEEQIIVELAQVPEHVDALVFLVTNYLGGFAGIDAVRGQLADVTEGIHRDICHYEAAGTGPHNAWVMFLMYRDVDAMLEASNTGNFVAKWKLKAIGSGVVAKDHQEAVSNWGRNQREKATPKRILLNRGDVLGFEGPDKIFIGCGWDVVPGLELPDLEVLCFLMERDSIKETVSMDHREACNGAVRHASEKQRGTTRTADNESIHITLSELPDWVTAIVFVISSRTKGTFLSVGATYCRLVNASSSPRREIAMFDAEARGDHNAMVQAQLFKDGEKWKLRALGNRGVLNRDSTDSILSYITQGKGDRDPVGSVPKCLELVTDDLLLFDGSRKAVVNVSWAAPAGTLQLHCLLLDARGQVLEDLDAGRAGADGAVEGTTIVPSKLLAESEGFQINLAAIAPKLKSIVFVVAAEGGSFQDVHKTQITLMDASGDTPRDIARYELGEARSSGRHSCLAVCILYRDLDPQKWKFRAIYEVFSGASVRNIVQQLQDKMVEYTPKALSMSKGDVISFVGAKRIMLGLGWDAEDGGARPPGVTALALVFNREGGQLETVDKTSRRSRTGKGCITHAAGPAKGRDVELVTVDLEAVPAEVGHVVLVLTAAENPQFRRVEHVCIRLCDTTLTPEREVSRFDLLKTGRGTHGALLLGHLYRDEDRWRLRTIGDPAPSARLEDLITVAAPYLGRTEEAGGCRCSIM